jgi:predicted metal-dependent enzyme (double-stranded beta helix superfamily)
MFDADTFVADCRKALAEASPGGAVRELLARALADPRDVERVLGTPTQAGFTTLHRSPDLTVINVIWAPCMDIYPHDHRMWAVIGLYGGREDNTFYRRTPRGLEAAGAKTLSVRDAALLGEHVVHAVANPLREFTGAIHVYGGDFFTAARSEWSDGLTTERPYDVEATRKVFADANARWRATVAGEAPVAR